MSTEAGRFQGRVPRLEGYDYYRLDARMRRIGNC